MDEILKKLENQNKFLNLACKSYNSKLMCLGYKMALDDIKAYLSSGFSGKVEVPQYDSEGRFLDE